MPAKKGARYKCEDCGLIVQVADPCGCEPTCQIICCGAPMKEATPKTKKQHDHSTKSIAKYP